jgi:hypothetical protein
MGSRVECGSGDPDVVHGDGSRRSSKLGENTPIVASHRRRHFEERNEGLLEEFTEKRAILLCPRAELEPVNADALRS